MDRQKVVVVQAHPDDELLWAWPVMQRLDLFDPAVVFACDNRQKYAKAPTAALFLGVKRGYTVGGVGLADSNFYQTPTRTASNLVGITTLIRVSLAKVMGEHGTDLVWTHNPVGEYGHGDHRLLWELVCTTPGVKRVLFSDICIKNKSHISYYEMPGFIWRQQYSCCQVGRRKVHGEGTFGLDKPQKLDLDWFNEGKQVYQDHRAWSWNNPVPETCNVYCIDL